MKSDTKICEQCKHFRQWYHHPQGRKVKVCVLPTKTLPSRETVKLERDDMPDTCVYKLEQIVIVGEEQYENK